MNSESFKLGIIGYPVKHSASPKMHNSALKHLGLDGDYKLYEVIPSGLGPFLTQLESDGVHGINVTVPHKEAVINYLDEVDPSAQAIGAVNTVLFKNGKRYGYNTDAPGFIMSLESIPGLSLINKSVCILGAGGSSRAIAHSFLGTDLVSLSFVNRTLSKANSIVESLPEYTHFSCRCLSFDSIDLFEILNDSDFIINTTSLGMDPLIGISPIPSDYVFKPSQIVVDIIYNPVETKFLTDAKNSGCSIINGAGMLAGQGALAFKLFTSHEIDFDFMLNELR